VFGLCYQRTEGGVTLRWLPHRAARVLLAAGLLFAAGPSWCQAPAWQAGIAQVAAKDRSPGTGFVVSLRGGRAYLVTLAHVVAGDPSPSVVFVADPDKNPYRAQVLDVGEGTDPRALALLQVQNPPAGVQAIAPATDTAIVPGREVVAAGFPSAIGRFSVLRANVVTVKGLDLYLSPVTLEGYSGGPVLMEGRIVGMVFGRLEDYGGAIPVAIVGQYLRGHEITWGAETVKRTPETPPAPVKPAEVVLRAGTVRINPNDGQPYVWIPPGEFLMGCSPGDQECYDDEKPPRRVRLTRGFWLGQTEVSVGAYKQYAAKMGISSPSEPVLGSTKLNPDWSDPEQPMVMISWQAAKSYCESWARGRLPTEAEWEYAARAGTTGARYGELDAIGWHANNSGGAIRRVKQKQPNAWGLYDTLGSVNEWAADWYEQTYYSTGPAVDPQGPADGQVRVPRGGSWYNPPRFLRLSARPKSVPDRRNPGLGVRCACDRLP